MKTLDAVDILISCALRFDGYQYNEDTGFDCRPAIETYRDCRKWNLADSEKLASFFLLQRGLCKWDLVHEPHNGRWWLAFRAMFFEVASLPVPDKYRHPEYFGKWEHDYKPRLQECIEIVRREQEAQHRSRRALSIRQPHAEAILRGVKPIELRSASTKIRGRIFIYASLGRYSAEEEAQMMEDYGIDDVTCEDLPRGVLVGTVELHDCNGGNWMLREPERETEPMKPKKHPQPVWFNPF